MLVVFAVAIVFEFIFILLYRAYYNEQYDAARQTVSIMKLIFLASGILELGLSVFWRWQKGKKIPYLFSIGVVSLVSALMLHWTVIYGIQMVKLLCVFCPVAAVLYFIYTVYQPEFFATSLAMVSGILSMWIDRRYCYTHPEIGKYSLQVALAVIIVIIAVTVWASLGKGVLKAGKWSYRLYRAKTSYPFPLVGMAAALAATAASVLFGIEVAYFAAIALAAVLFVYAVYYTVKLM